MIKQGTLPLHQLKSSTNVCCCCMRRVYLMGTQNQINLYKKCKTKRESNSPGKLKNIPQFKPPYHSSNRNAWKPSMFVCLFCFVCFCLVFCLFVLCVFVFVFVFVIRHVACCRNSIEYWSLTWQWFNLADWGFVKKKKNEVERTT